MRTPRAPQPARSSGAGNTDQGDQAASGAASEIPLNEAWGSRPRDRSARIGGQRATLARSVFDRQTNEFRDLVISRIEAAAPVPGADVQPHEAADADTDWNRQVDLVLVVHPAVKHPEIVQRDFGMRRGELHVTVRAAIAGYVLQFWNVDCSPDRSLDPTIHRLCLKNLNAIKGTRSLEIAPGFAGVRLGGSPIHS